MDKALKIQQIQANIDKLNLSNDYTLENLECNGLHLIQYRNGYRFNSDSVLLANFARAKRRDKVVELCAGSGVISLLMESKYNLTNITCVELQPNMYSILKDNIALNNSAINAICGDVNDITNYIPYGSCDVVVVNPPYSKVCTNLTSENESVAIARQEIKLNLESLVTNISKILRFGGNAYIIYKSSRLIELINELTRNNLATKHIISIQPNANKKIDSVIVTATKGGAISSLVMENFILLENNGELTEKAKELYNKS